MIMVRARLPPCAQNIAAAEELQLTTRHTTTLGKQLIYKDEMKLHSKVACEQSLHAEYCFTVSGSEEPNTQIHALNAAYPAELSRHTAYCSRGGVLICHLAFAASSTGNLQTKRSR